MLHEIITTLSIVCLQCTIMLRKYIEVEKNQKETFGNSPSMMPYILDTPGRLVPYSPFVHVMFLC